MNFSFNIISRSGINKNSVFLLDIFFFSHVYVFSCAIIGYWLEETIDVDAAPEVGHWEQK